MITIKIMLRLDLSKNTIKVKYWHLKGSKNKNNISIIKGFFVTANHVRNVENLEIS